MNSDPTFTGEYLYSQTNFKIPKTKSQDAPPDRYSGLFGVLDNAPEQQLISEKRLAPQPQNRKRKVDIMDIDDEIAVPATEPKRIRICDALKEMLEDDLPAELKALMQPLCCDLCNAKLNSILTANMHYDSKNHDKKVNNWLMEWSKKTGQSVPVRQRVLKDGPVGPNAFHCDDCDIALTSLQHARTHYTGRRHQLVVAKRSKPSGSGYYGHDGKWVRQATTITNDPSGRFGIGQSFVPQPTPVVPHTNQSIHCDLCNISVTSDSQMQLHLSGSKHAKRLKATTEATIPPTDNDTIMESIVGAQSTPNRDISIHRTPSGNYYCSICDITVNNDNLFNQHLDSKKHMKKFKATQ